MKIFHENLVAIHMKQDKINLDKSISVGFSVLDLSKTLMYDFHYNYMKKKYGDKAKLLFTDTDSLCYEIETDDIFKDMWEKKELFDFSDFPDDCKYFDATNKKVIGVFKSETGFIVIIEFVGLRSKMYSILPEKKDEEGKEEEKKKETKRERKAKGIKKGVIEKDLKHQTYVDVLKNGTQQMASMKTIRSDHHQVYSYTINKIGLSAYDDKRYILDDGMNTLAIGHYKTTEAL
jgi:hypothetical protein